jgi:lipopolysaccharide/colanic/teichoic acid biosynthesis glycosyltransferase
MMRELAPESWQSTLHVSAMPPAPASPAGWPPTPALKRFLDVGISLSLLILLVPLLVLIALLIWSQDKTPVLYLSERIGRNGRPFTMYKFRTMVVGAELLKQNLYRRNERNAVLFKIANDPRITRIGRVLRKYSLDEIPQLINVLCGHMSLVGPRPPLASEVEQYSPHQFIRLKVLPGITGLWQIKARRSSSFHDYITLDAAYIQNWCLWLDIKILWSTIGVVLAGTGD